MLRFIIEFVVVATLITMGVIYLPPIGSALVNIGILLLEARNFKGQPMWLKQLFSFAIGLNIGNIIFSIWK